MSRNNDRLFSTNEGLYSYWDIYMCVWFLSILTVVHFFSLPPHLSLSFSLWCSLSLVFSDSRSLVFSSSFVTYVDSLSRRNCRLQNYYKHGWIERDLPRLLFLLLLRSRYFCSVLRLSLVRKYRLQYRTPICALSWWENAGKQRK